MDLKQLAAEERHDLADFLTTLTPQQWQAPSLCEQWTMSQVVAHMISYEELSWGGLLGRFARGRLSVDRINALGLADYQHHQPEQLCALLREHARPRGLTAGFGGGIALTDGVIHHQDIRRALAAPRNIPDERLHAVLPFALKAPTLSGRKLTHGLRLIATDLDWSTGNGPNVTGPAEALLMAIAGRPAALNDLDGDGAHTLTRRLTGTT